MASDAADLEAVLRSRDTARRIKEQYEGTYGVQFGGAASDLLVVNKGDMFRALKHSEDYGLTVKSRTTSAAMQQLKICALAASSMAEHELELIGAAACQPADPSPSSHTKAVNTTGTKVRHVRLTESPHTGSTQPVPTRALQQSTSSVPQHHDLQAVARHVIGPGPICAPQHTGITSSTAPGLQQHLEKLSLQQPVCVSSISLDDNLESLADVPLSPPLHPRAAPSKAATPFAPAPGKTSRPDVPHLLINVPGGCSVGTEHGMQDVNRSCFNFKQQEGSCQVDCSVPLQSTSPLHSASQSQRRCTADGSATSTGRHSKVVADDPPPSGRLSSRINKSHSTAGAGSSRDMKGIVHTLGSEEVARRGLSRDLVDRTLFQARSYSIKPVWEPSSNKILKAAVPDNYSSTPEEEERRQQQNIAAATHLRAAAQQTIQEAAAKTERKLLIQAGKIPLRPKSAVSRCRVVQRPSSAPVKPRYLDWHPSSRPSSPTLGSASDLQQASPSSCDVDSYSKPLASTGATGICRSSNMLADEASSHPINSQLHKTHTATALALFGPQHNGCAVPPSPHPTFCHSAQGEHQISLCHTAVDSANARFPPHSGSARGEGVYDDPDPELIDAELEVQMLMASAATSASAQAHLPEGITSIGHYRLQQRQQQKWMCQPLTAAASLPPRPATAMSHSISQTHSAFTSQHRPGCSYHKGRPSSQCSQTSATRLQLGDSRARCQQAQRQQQSATSCRTAVTHLHKRDAMGKNGVTTAIQATQPFQAVNLDVHKHSKRPGSAPAFQDAQSDLPGSGQKGNSTSHHNPATGQQIANAAGQDASLATVSVLPLQQHHDRWNLGITLQAKPLAPNLLECMMSAYQGK